MAETAISGWYKPMYQALSETVPFAGVPQTFFIFNALAAMAVFWIWWKLLALNVLAHGIAWVGTQCDPHWWGILRQYVRYRRVYEA